MATDIAKAYVQIIPSAEGIGSGISDILSNDAEKAGTSSGKKFGSSFGGAIGTGMKVAGAAAATAAAGMVTLGNSMVTNAKETAAYGDNVDKLSQKIGISAEAFQEWDYVFSQNGADIGILEGGMKKLSGVVADAAGGSKSAQETFKQLGLSVQDLSGLSQEDIFGRVIEQLQQMPESAERTALASDLLGRSAMELGPLLNQTASDTEALKQQAHDLGMIMSDEAVSNSAAFTDAMDNMSRAMDGAKNTIVSSLLPGFTEITNGFANLIAGNDGATEQMKNGFVSLGQSLNSAIPSITQGLTSIVSAVAEVAPEIITTLGSSLMQALPQLAGVLKGLIPQLVQGISSMLPELVQVGLEIIAELATGIAQALPDMVPQIIEIIMQIVDTLIQNIPMLLDAAIQLITGLAEGLLNAIPVLIEYIPKIITSLVDALVTGIPMLIDGAIKLVMALVEALPEIIQALIDALPQIIQAIADALPELVDALIQGTVQLVIALAEALPEICMALIEALPAIIDAIIQGLAALGDALLQCFSTAFEACRPVFDKLAQFASDTWAKIKQPFENAANWFHGIFQSAVNGVKNVWNGITTFFNNIWQEICNVFSDAVDRFKQIGTNIVNGIKEGIAAAWEKLKSWFNDQVSGLIDGAKDLLGISSPSKVFAQQVGQWIPAGIALGIQEGMGVLDDQIKTMTDEALVGTVTATTESVNSMNYVPNTMAIQAPDDRMLTLLAEYLPILANKDTVVDIRQNDRGTFEQVRTQNNRLVVATGYHALA